MGALHCLNFFTFTEQILAYNRKIVPGMENIQFSEKMPTVRFALFSPMNNCNPRAARFFALLLYDHRIFFINQPIMESISLQTVPQGCIFFLFVHDFCQTNYILKEIVCLFVFLDFGFFVVFLSVVLTESVSIDEKIQI